jgi:hypothetical protein
MPRLKWKSFLSFLTVRATSGGTQSADRSRRTRLVLEELEERSVPSATPTVDLTTAGAFGEINGAIYRQFSPQPTGTGFIDSFVRLQAKGAGAQTEQGYNTDARPLQFDENRSPQFTRSLLLSSVPLVDIGGVTYREFLLDINQKASQPYLSLDHLRLYQGNAPDVTGYDATTNLLAGLSPVYDMTAGGDNWVQLNARLSHGSGSGDMLLYVPNSDFTGSASYVYLYSNFGAHYMANSGFEEWAVGKGGVSVTAATGQSAGSISGTVFDHGTGQPIADVVVFLDTNGNGVLDNNEVYTVTDANGNYTFIGLTTGLAGFSTYTIDVLPPPNYNTTTAVEIGLEMTAQQVYNVNFFLTSKTLGE